MYLAKTCYSSLKLSDLVGYLDAADRQTVRAIVEAHRIDSAIEVEAQVVREVAARRCGPMAAVVADIVETASAVVAITRTRVPYSRCRTKLAGEVHAFVCIVVWIATKG